MIVTLAGHVDHGKTSIVRALTGVDTDRLEEEKRRGLTIDLGFAYTRLGPHRIGFVDVPGHHRFVHNMVAGVASMQHALLVVAADDGVMPQTREHLQIQSLLGIRSGIVALNKVDRVAPERVAEVRQQIAALVAGSFLEGAPVIEISCEDQRGVDALREALTAAAEHQDALAADAEFRLPIDRTFTVRGAGLVVTGTVVSGSVSVGDELMVAATGERLRVRDLHVQDEAAETARIGDRTALNLAGSTRAELVRGDWIVAPTSRYVVEHPCIALQVVDDFPRAVKHWAPVHVYHATSHSQARVALLESGAVEPGGRALVDLVLDAPLHVKVGDRLIVRDQDLGRTLGGGRVVDVVAPTGRRRHPRRQERLRALAQFAPEATLAWLSQRAVVSLDEFRRGRNLTADAAERLVGSLDLRRRDDLLLHADRFAELRNAVVERLQQHHRDHPDSDGMTEVELRERLQIDVATLAFVLAELVAAGELRLRNGRYAQVAHRAEVPKALQTLYDQVAPILDSTQPPSLGDLGKQLKRDLNAFTREMRALAGVGLCVQVSANRFYLPEHLRAMAEIAVRLNAAKPFTVREFRDASGVGRNVVIEVLEYFDARGLTRREGDQRRVVAPVEAILD